MNPKDIAGAKKPNLSVLPFAPLLDVIPALYEGRRKYGPWNWRAEEVSETIYADAAIRHLMQFISGEDIDPDSGVHHISKAIAGLLVVRDAQIHGCSIDDRYVNQDLQIDKQVEQLAGVDERYPDPVPSTLPPRDNIAADKFTEGDVGSPVFGTTEDGVDVVGTIVCWDEDKSGLALKVHFKALEDYHWYTVDGQIDPNAEHTDGLPPFVTRERHSKVVEFSLKNEPQSPTVTFFMDKCCQAQQEGDAEKLAEVYGIKEVLSKWSDTQSGNGTYEITRGDVGKTVLLRDGRFGKISAWDTVSFWPALISVDNVTCCSVSARGQQTIGGDQDVLRVYHV